VADLDRLRTNEPFLDWSRSALRVLRAMASGEVMDTAAIEDAARALEGRLSYQGVRGGVRELARDRRWVYNPGSDSYELAKVEPLLEMWGGKTAEGAACYVQQLTERGVELAKLCLELAPPEREVEPAEVEPPEPVTPLWRVLCDDGERIVVAASRARAVELAGERAIRAESVDTAVEQVVCAA
jgi:hypothetical protein